MTRRMKIIDQVRWTRVKLNNSDPYGTAICEYAERWADFSL
mgnify:FL=1